MGGMFICGQCGGDHHTDDGYNVAKKPDGSVFEFCEDCYVDVAEAHLNGDRPLTELDGKSLEEHFVCPGCLDVRPNARLAKGPFVGCVDCDELVPF